MTDPRIEYVVQSTQQMAELEKMERNLSERRAKALKSLVEDSGMTVTDIADEAGIPRQTLYKALKRAYPSE